MLLYSSSNLFTLYSLPSSLFIYTPSPWFCSFAIALFTFYWTVSSCSPITYPWRLLLHSCSGLAKIDADRESWEAANIKPFLSPYNSTTLPLKVAESSVPLRQLSTTVVTDICERVAPRFAVVLVASLVRYCLRRPARTLSIILPSAGFIYINRYNGTTIIGSENGRQWRRQQ